MKVHQPLHLTPKWISEDLAQEREDKSAGRAVRRKIYLRAQPFSIRQYIARAEKLKKP